MRDDFKMPARWVVVFVFIVFFMVASAVQDTKQDAKIKTLEGKVERLEKAGR